MDMKKNVLIVSPFPIYPLTSGGHQAIFNGMACLRGVANVFLVYTTTESRVKKGECRALEEKLPFVKCVPFIEPSSRHNIAWAWRCSINKLKQCGIVSKFITGYLEGKTTGVEKKKVLSFEIGMISEGFQKHVLSVIGKYHIDIVQMEMMETIRMVDALPKHVKKVFVHHELRWVRNELLLAQIEATEDMRKRVEENKKEEIEYLNRYDQIIVLSETDKKKLQKEGVKTKILTSFAVVGGENQEIDVVEGDAKRLICIGPSFHYPNYDGVMWFLENCWNELQGVSSEYQLHIIGNWEQDKKDSIVKMYKNVHFLGFVDDLSEVARGSIEIVPLRIGSGIRMKILEAARLGVPVVSTTIGAEGLPLRNGENVVLADTPKEFVEGICMLQDPEERERLVFNMQWSVSPKFSLDALRENRKLLYE